MSLFKKLENGERIGGDEALELYDMELFDLGKLADESRRRRWGNKVFFNINRHINPTNICADSCKFCAFSAHRKNPNPYKMSYDEMISIAQNAVKAGADELHIVSAHNKDDGWQWYMEGFRRIKQACPQVHIKAMTAAEVDFVSRCFGLSYEQVLDEMIASGVDSMPGGGAEIFASDVRQKICKGKVSGDDWLKIHSLWHARGRQSNATMLYGHIESRADRIDHMLRIREVQDASGGFNAFIPLVYQRANNYLKVDKFMGSSEILKTIAIARLVLDNVPHIKAYWATMSINLAMIAQEFGADDLDGTIEKESIQSAAGAGSSGGMKLMEFIDIIKTSGFLPVQRDSLYNELKFY